MTCREKIDCWCSVCHTESLRRIKDRGLGLERLLQKFELHKDRESRKLESVFDEVLNTTVYAKLAKESVYRTTGYRNMKSYYKHIHPNENDTVLQRYADAINHASLVYDDIAKIYDNIVQIRNEIDIRRLSLQMLYQARSLNWCYDYAEKIRGRKRRRPDELEYSEADFQAIVHQVAHSPAFQAVSHDKSLVASFTARLGSELMKRARRR